MFQEALRLGRSIISGSIDGSRCQSYWPKIASRISCSCCRLDAAISRILWRAPLDGRVVVAESRELEGEERLTVAFRVAGPP